MPRARLIKPGFFVNDELADVAPLGRLLFAGLWTIADKAGRLEDRPKRIKAEVLPYDDCEPDALLSALAERGFIQRYEVDGERYIQITKFRAHQTPHVREPESTIPPPPDEQPLPDQHSASTVQASDKHESSPSVYGIRFTVPESGSSTSEPGVLVSENAPAPEKPQPRDRGGGDAKPVRVVGTGEAAMLLHEFRVAGDVKPDRWRHEENAAKWLLSQGHNREQVLACQAHYKAQPFWNDKPFTLEKVKDHIKAFVAAEKGGTLNGKQGSNTAQRGAKAQPHSGKSVAEQFREAYGDNAVPDV